jgi:heat shock protein HslJ
MRLSALLACVVVLCALPACAAEGALSGKWRIVAVAGAEEFDVARARAEFAENGRFASTIGCNRIAGTPTISGARLAFGPMAVTRMACPPPLDAVERRYLAALEAVRGYRVEGGKLVFVNDAGEVLVTLERTSSGHR